MYTLEGTRPFQWPVSCFVSFPLRWEVPRADQNSGGRHWPQLWVSFQTLHQQSTYGSLGARPIHTTHAPGNICVSISVWRPTFFYIWTNLSPFFLLQLYNFLRFCEMLLKASCKVKKIHLLTSQDEVGHEINRTHDVSASALPCYWCFIFCHPLLQVDGSQQSSALAEIKQSLGAHGVALDLQYSTTIHDREIR